MKVVLSRKGFDSAAGGFASPIIMPEGIMQSLPIPSDIGPRLYSEVDLISDTIPQHVKEHPHTEKDFIDAHRENNSIYISRESVSWDDDIPGYCLLRYCPEVILTAEGMPRSRWNLEDKWGLKHSDNKPGITYHSEQSWKKDYFQSACRGQEFVIDENQAVTEWAEKLISNYRCQ